jgi:hypothetical protein
MRRRELLAGAGAAVGLTVTSATASEDAAQTADTGESDPMLVWFDDGRVEQRRVSVDVDTLVDHYKTPYVTVELPGPNGQEHQLWFTEPQAFALRDALQEEGWKATRELNRREQEEGQR